MKSLKDKIVWITGASSGIGEALAVVCAREGARLVLTARREEELKRVAGLTGLNEEAIMILPADLYQYDNVESLTNQVISRFGKVDILFNNAGISSRALAIESSLEIDKKVMDLDYFSVIALTKAVLPHMVSRKSGHIVVTSSVVGKIGTPMRSAYSAAKHALHGFFDSMRQEVHDDGVRVTIVCAGYIKTQVSVNAITPNGERFNKMSRKQAAGIDPIKMAEKMVQAVHKNKAEILYGGFEIVGVYLGKFFPALLNRYLYNMHRKNSFVE